MNAQTELLHLLKQQTTDSVYPLILEKKVDETAFEKLTRFLENMTITLKNEDYIFKTLLREILLASNAIKTENEEMNSDYLNEIAKKIDKCMFLIIAGKSINDRKPGVPRII